MIALLLTLQIVDHLDRDFTHEGLSLLSGEHVHVRILTVTTLGEVVPDGAPLGIEAEAIVVDGVVAGGPDAVVFEAGGMHAGRYPVLLSPPDGAVLSAAPVLLWYAASATPGLTYKLVIDGPGGPYTASGLEQTNAGPLALPEGEFDWRVEAVSPLGVFASEVWSFTLTSSTPPPGDDPPLTFPGDDDGDGTVDDPTPTITWDPVAGADGYEVTFVDEEGNPIGCAGGFTTATSWTVPDTCPLPDGTYTVVVQPVDGEGEPVDDPMTGILVIDTGGHGPPTGDGPAAPEGARDGQRRSGGKSFCQFRLSAGDLAGSWGWIALAVALAVGVRVRTARTEIRGRARRRGEVSLGSVASESGSSSAGVSFWRRMP